MTVELISPIARQKGKISENTGLGWLRLEYSLFYRALLQKRPIILGSLLIVAIPSLVIFVAEAVKVTHSFV